MRVLFLAATGLLSVSLLACTTPVDESGPDGAQTEALPPLAKAFEGTVQPWSLAVGPEGDLFFAGTYSWDLDFGGGTLTAEPKGSLFLAHLDAAGEHLFSGSTASGSEDRPWDVAVGPSGDLYMVGYFNGNINFGSGKMSGDQDGFFAAFTEDGSPDHSFSARGISYDALTGVTTTPAGIVIVAGRVGDDVDLGAGPKGEEFGMRTVLAAYDRKGAHLWELRFPGDFFNRFEIASDAAGNVYLAGEAWSDIEMGALSASPGVIVLKLDPSGEPLWIRSTNTDGGGARLSGLGVDAAGDVVITGTYYDAFTLGSYQAEYPSANEGGYVAKLSGAGETRFLKTFDLLSWGSWLTSAVSREGETLVAVSTYAGVDFGAGPIGPVDGDGTDIVLARYDAEGGVSATKHLAGTANENVWSVAMSPDGAPVLLGTFTGELELGEETLVSTNGSSLFVGRLDL